MKREMFSYKAENILSAWTVLEVLTPQRFSKPSKNAEDKIISLKDAISEWRNPYKAKPKDSERKIYYEIILGTIDLKKSIRELEKVYVDNRIERPSSGDECVLATFTVDCDGIPSDWDPVISSFAWGLDKALNKNLTELAKWPIFEKELVSALRKITHSTDENGKLVPLDGNIIQTAYNFLVSELKLSNDFIKEPEFTIRKYRYFKDTPPESSILLNSFFLNDLETAKHLSIKGKLTENLQKYLGIVKPQKRLDLLNNDCHLDSALEPQLIPPARWPSPGRHSLVLLQQAAVNLAMSELNEKGILSVNGPPGTGKTTLLRDILAAIVAKRAKALSEFDNPKDAFTESEHSEKLGSATLCLHKLHKNLIGYKVVIASSNNKGGRKY